MISLYNKYKWLRLCAGIIFLVVGILTIVISYANAGIISTTISIAIACILFLAGGVTFIATLIEDKRSAFPPSLGVAALLIAIGIVLCIDTALLSNIAAYFVGGYTIAFGTICVFKGIQLTKYRAKWYAYLLCFLIGVLGITFGILALIYRAKVISLIYILLGCCFIVLGMNEIVYGVKALK